MAMMTWTSRCNAARWRSSRNDWSRSACPAVSSRIRARLTDACANAWPVNRIEPSAFVGVTGTHGKTTTSILIASVLQAAHQTVGVTCSLGYSDGESTGMADTATPPPHELARWLNRMAQNGCTHGVLEVSSQALATRQLSGVSFDAAVLTNVRREHLDLHGTVANYRRAKQRLFEHLKPGGFAVMNVDDIASQEILEGLNVPLITVGLRNTAQVQAKLLERCVSEQTFLLTAGQSGTRSARGPLAISSSTAACPPPPSDWCSVSI